MGCDLRDGTVDLLVATLRDITSLETLDLSSNEFESAGTKKLFEFLKENKTVKEFKYGGNNVDEELAKTIASDIVHNKTLRSLSFGKSSVTSSERVDLGDIGGKALGVLLRLNPTLTELVIDRKNWVCIL